MDNADKNTKKQKPKDTNCKACGAPLPSSGSQHGPFCSARCKMQDLSKWFGESYRIASTPAHQPPDEE